MLIGVIKMSVKDMVKSRINKLLGKEYENFFKNVQVKKRESPWHNCAQIEDVFKGDTLDSKSKVKEKIGALLADGVEITSIQFGSFSLEEKVDKSRDILGLGYESVIKNDVWKIKIQKGKDKVILFTVGSDLAVFTSNTYDGFNQKYYRESLMEEREKLMDKKNSIAEENNKEEKSVSERKTTEIKAEKKRLVTPDDLVRLYWETQRELEGVILEKRPDGGFHYQTGRINSNSGAHITDIIPEGGVNGELGAKAVTKYKVSMCGYALERDCPEMYISREKFKIIQKIYNQQEKQKQEWIMQQKAKQTGGR